jgi:hypothetical protein
LANVSVVKQVIYFGTEGVQSRSYTQIVVIWSAAEKVEQ